MDEDADPIQILLLEDSDIDADLVVEHLERSLGAFKLSRADGREAYVRALDAGDIDLILSDYALPDFDGMTALAIARERRPDLPFIFVSGVLGEEFATESLKQGATDYVLKQRLTRLPAAVTRALAETRERAERQRAERALKSSEESLRLALEAGELGSWELDVSTGRAIYSERFHQILGHGEPAGGWELHHFIDRVVEEDREATLKSILAAREGKSSWRFQCRYRRADDEVRWIEARGGPVGDGGRLIGIIADITERKAAEAELHSRVADRTAELAEANAALHAQIAEREKVEATLRQMQRLEAVGQLTSGVAHDFNNLLTVILGNLDFIARSVTDPKLAVRLSHVRQAAERGATLTGQLLAFSRRQRLEPKPIDLNQTVAGMGDLLRSTMGGSVRLETVLKDGLWPALVDPTQIELVILNLAINARDAMQVGGALTIETANVRLSQAPRRPEEPSPGDYVMVSVTDTGTGMSDEVLAKVFEPFFTTKEIGKGSGLGLSQVLGFAQQSGGGVRIDTQVGEGASIKVYLPRAAAQEAEIAAPAREPAPRASPGGHRQTVMVVDDDSLVREIVVALLEEDGYHVIPAGSGPAALDLLDHGQAVDLLLVDFAMPGMNGAEVAAKALEQRPGLPILFVTGYADFTALRAVGDDRIIQKPFQDDELSHKVRQALGAGNSDTVVPFRSRN